MAVDNPRAEWLEADGLGGFASGTVCGIRTRRYHALLLAATEPPAGRMVLVNGFDAVLETESDQVALSTQRYAPGVDTPDGDSRLQSFIADPWPRWVYAVPGGAVTQELFVPRDRSMVVLVWRWVGPTSTKLRLTIRPFFSGRDFHGTHHENPAFRFEPELLAGAERWKFYDGVPAVTARGNGVYHHAPCWYRQFLYDEEAERGLDAVEDLANPGFYQFDLSRGPGVLIFSAGDETISPSTSATVLAEQLAAKERARRSAFASPRLLAADAYLVRRGTGKTIIAGYPWFGDWGRDTFISMRGLCLATGRLNEARDILLAWATVVSEGMLPNRFPDRGDTPEYNSVDASLWYVIVVHEFLAAEKDAACKGTLLAAVEAILTGYRDGTRFGIRADTDGLMACGEPDVQLTWMDAKVGDWVVTPRTGKPVEIQALWLNALHFAAMHNPVWQTLFERGLESFRQRFWNEARGCLYDVVDVDHQAGQLDDRIRPNQIFAVGGLPLALIEGEHAARVLQTARERLWTPMGLRSLAAGEKDYASRYTGPQLERDGAYHQGTVWPWLAGPFLEAVARTNGKSVARDLLAGSWLPKTGLQGHLPEIADAEAPYTARGCPEQAWSLGEMLRIGTILEG